MFVSGREREILNCVVYNQPHEDDESLHLKLHLSLSCCKLWSWVFFIPNRILWEWITTKCVNIWKAGIIITFDFFLRTVKLSYTNYSTEECLLLQFFLLVFHRCFPKIDEISLRTIDMQKPGHNHVWLSKNRAGSFLATWGSFFVVVLRYRLFLPCFITKAADE